MYGGRHRAARRRLWSAPWPDSPGETRACQSCPKKRSVRISSVRNSRSLREIKIPKSWWHSKARSPCPTQTGASESPSVRAHSSGRRCPRRVGSAALPAPGVLVTTGRKLRLAPNHCLSARFVGLPKNARFMRQVWSKLKAAFTVLLCIFSGYLTNR